jgi:ribosomal protein S18 acetylase RimI-like enzyme
MGGLLIADASFKTKSSSFVVRRSVMSDANSITRLIGRSFPGVFLKCSIFGYPGSKRFLEQELSLPVELQDSCRLVASIGDEIAGYIDLKPAGDTLFLSYVAVEKRFQNKKIASRLLDTAIREASSPRISKLALDVLVDNEPAQKWYSGLGLKGNGHTFWVKQKVRLKGKVEPLKVVGFASAQVTQERYGFSEFILITGSGTRRVGRLGPELFRVADKMGIDDPMISTLQTLDSNRYILELQDDFSLDKDGPEKECVAQTLRLSGSLSEVLAKIEKHYEN